MIDTTCQTIYTGSQGILTWEWDNNLKAALSVATKDNSQKVLSVLGKALPSAWNTKTISSACMPIQALAGSTGGLREGQELFTGPSDESVCVFAAWWPWGNGQKYSVRIGLFYQDSSQIKKADFQQQLRRHFALD